MNRRYDVLLCDADDTVFDFQKAEENAFAAACAFADVPATREMLSLYSGINDALWKLFERGGIEQSVLRVRRFEQFLAQIGRGGVNARAMSEAFVEALGEQSVPLPGAVEAVRRWRRILPVVIVTNGIAKVQHGRMDKSEIRRDVSGMIISEEVGAAKPDPKMIEAGMALAGVSDRARVLMLGDSLTSDMKAAANARVDACWFNPKGKKNDKGVPVTYEIRSLDEVDAILMGEEEMKA